MAKIKKAVRYFDKQVGHFTDMQKIFKIRVETMELQGAINYKTLEVDQNFANAAIIDECSDVLTVAFHIATRNGLSRFNILNIGDLLQAFRYRKYYFNYEKS